MGPRRARSGCRLGSDDRMADWSRLSSLGNGKMDGEIYFLLQRIPSLVFSTRIPASMSSARSASERLKSRARRGGPISGISFTHWSESPPDLPRREGRGVISFSWPSARAQSTMPASWARHRLSGQRRFRRTSRLRPATDDIIFLHLAGIDGGVGSANHLENRAWACAVFKSSSMPACMRSAVSLASLDMLSVARGKFAGRETQSESCADDRPKLPPAAVRQR